MTQSGRMSIARLGDWLTRHQYVLPLAILIVGGAFRFYNLNWDNGYQLHPDERWIYMVLSGAGGNGPLTWPSSVSQLFNVTPCNGAATCPGSPLDPHFFAYGSLPFYLLALLAGTLNIIGQHVPGLSAWTQFATYGGVPPLGRALSGVLDLAGVCIVFLIGRRVFGYWTGVLAMALAACTVLDIQLSHFYTVDTVLTPLALATVLAAVVMVQSGSRRPYVLGGIAFGAALATKTTALLLVVPLGAAAVLAAWMSVPWTRSGSLVADTVRHYASVAERLNSNLQWLLGTYLIAAATFVVCEPYAVLDRSKLLGDIQSQSQILVTNTTGYGTPFMVQYAHTLPYFYQLKNMLFWTMGLPLGIAALAGVVFYLGRNTIRLRADEAVLLVWVLPYFFFVGRFFAKFNRYMLPIMPIMTVLGAALLVMLVRRVRFRVRPLAWGAVAVVTLGSFLYALAYMNIYEHPNTRVAATNWIYAHIPAGTTIAVENPWDDPLPFPDGALSPNRYHTINLDLYADELSAGGQKAKIRNITDALTHAQYIILSSERLIRSIPRLPDYYPIATRYYQLLQSGGLNFRQELQFQQHPQLGPIIVHDYPADESFHVYDHPDVRIFKRVANTTPQQVAALLTTDLTPLVGSAAPAPGPAPVPPPAAAPTPRPAHAVPDTRLMLSAAQWRKDQNGPTFDSMFPPGGFAMQHPLLIWFLLLELLGLLAFPIAFLVLRNLADRGFVIAKTIGLLVLCWVVWIAVSLGLATYDRGLLLVVLLLFVLGSLSLYAHLARPLLAYIRARWRQMLVGEAVFLAGFAIFILLRMWYPDLGHQFSYVSQTNMGSGRMGEKQMELAFLNAIVRSRVFPPYDPFFAHGYINYYYYGFFLVGTLCKLAEISPAVGFNLAVATFFALLVGNVSSVVLTLTRRITPAVLAAAFVGIIGNLNGGWQLIRGLMGVGTVHSSVPFYGGALDVLSGLREVLFGGRALPAFDYWEPTRIIPPAGGPITEFPYFTYLFADLHPHLIAYPMTAAALALAVNFLGPRARGWVFVLWIAVSGIVLGAIAVTNPWDFPTYAVVFAVGAVVGAFAVKRAIRLRLFWDPAKRVALVGLTSVLCYLPFKLNYQTVFNTGVGLVRNITPDMLGSSFTPTQVNDALITPLRIYLEHFGLFVFAIVSYVILMAAFDPEVRRRANAWSRWTELVWARRRDIPRVLRASADARRMRAARSPLVDPSVAAGAVVVVLGLLLFGYTLLAFLAALGLLVVFVLRQGMRRLPATRLFVLALMLVPLALSFGTQIVFVKDWLAQGPDFRMNTIFKFYNQTWVLFAVCAACALYYFMERDNRESAGNGAARRVRRPGADTRRAIVPVLPELGPQRGESDLLHGTLPVSNRMPALALAPEGVGHFSPVGASAAADDLAPSPPPEDVTDTGRPAALKKPAPVQRVLALAGRRRLWSGCVLVLILTSLIYTYAGTISRETARQDWLPERSVPLTLDGMAFMKVAYPEDYAAISWLNRNVRGAQVMVEADTSYYNWQSRVSQFTGLPDIYNGIHEGEQRWADEIDPTQLCASTANPDACLSTTHSRPDDVKTLYDSPSISTAWRIIRTYGVRYIYVGFSERQCTQDQCFSRAGLAKFDRMVGHGLHVAFRDGATTIYGVTRA